MGLKLVRRKNSPNWFLRGTVRGHTIFESTGTSRKQIAEDIRIKREDEILQESVHGRRATWTFEDAVLDYLEHGGDSRFVGTWNAETRTGTWLFEHFAGRRINDITQSDLDEVAKALLPNANWQTRNRQVYTPFVAIYRRAVANKAADDRMWQRPRKPQGVQHNNQPTRRGTTSMDYDQAAEFLQWMSPAPGMVALMLMYTGCRSGELYGLQGDSVRPEESWMIITSSKSGDGRGVPLHSVLHPMARALKEVGGVLLRTATGAPYASGRNTGGQLKAAFRGARERSGIDAMSPNTFRHMVQTQLSVNGIGDATIDQIVGHAPRSVGRKHYINLPVPHLIEAIETLPVPDVLDDIPWVRDPLPYIDRLIDAHNSKRLGKPVYMKPIKRARRNPVAAQ